MLPGDNVCADIGGASATRGFDHRRVGPFRRPSDNLFLHAATNPASKRTSRRKKNSVSILSRADPGGAYIVMTMIAYAFLQHRRLATARRKKESTARRPSRLCLPYARPSSKYSLDYRRNDVPTVENGFATSSGVSKSAKVVLGSRLITSTIQSCQADSLKAKSIVSVSYSRRPLRLLGALAFGSKPPSFGGRIAFIVYRLPLLLRIPNSKALVIIFSVTSPLKLDTRDNGSCPKLSCCAIHSETDIAIGTRVEPANPSAKPIATAPSLSFVQMYRPHQVSSNPRFGDHETGSAILG